MARYIELDALVAEIEKLVDKGTYHEEFDRAYRYGNNGALYALKERLNTLEVKEVDLEKEYKDFVDNVEGMPRMWHSDGQIEWAKDIARHFFELGMAVGLKAQKGE